MEVCRGDGDGTRLAANLGSAANGFDLRVSRCLGVGDIEPPIAESRDAVGISGGWFSIMSDKFSLILLLAGGGEGLLSSTSIWNTEEMPLDALIGLGDLMGKSLLGLITIGSGRLPCA